MTERQTLFWIKANLSSYISQAIKPGMIYSEDWIAGMVMRETGFKIMKYAGLTFSEVCLQMKGDWSKRIHDAEPRYHGYGFMQIDIDSYPDFVASGDWKDPLKTFNQGIKVLEEKRFYIQSKSSVGGEELFKAITAAYNSGQGNAVKDLADGHIDDTYTFNHDYVKEVWRFRKLYTAL